MSNEIAPPPPGVVFEHYEVLTRSDGTLYELGRGAMGITYKAFDRNLRVPVALKVINTAALDSDTAKEQFIYEARSAAKLRHRHVASVFHLGIEGDTCFYAMEFIDGETVEALCRRHGPLPPLIALRFVLQVAKALVAAQQHGLVHRDLKPANLMLVQEDEEMCVKVIDFGLAKSCLKDDPEACESKSGFVGTPDYASPEQLQDRPVDVRSDIYSLGATFWFMLAGRPPYAGTTEEVIKQHLSAEPPFDALSDLPVYVLGLLSRMLAKDPAARPQTAADLRRDVEGCIEQTAGGPVVAAARLAIEEQRLMATTASDGVSLGESLDVGATVGEHFQIVQKLGETNDGWLFRARHMELKREVRLRLLRRDFTYGRQALTQLEEEVRRLSEVKHANVLEVLGLEAIGSSVLIVTEWTDGMTLLEVLRARRELNENEVMALLEQMASAVDYATQCDLGQLDLGLHQVFIHFPHLPEALADLLHKDVSAWPEFLVKLNPLGAVAELAVSATMVGGQTIVGGLAAVAAHGEQKASAKPAYTRTLAALVYELFGGVIAPGVAGDARAGGQRYTPLAHLTEEGNEVLRRALDPQRSFESGADFVHALRRVGRLCTHHSGFGAKSKTGPLHPVSAASPEPLAPKKMPWLVIGGALAAGLVALVLFVKMPKSGDKAGTGQPTPIAKVAPKPESNNEHEAAPTPVVLSRSELLTKASTAAQRTEEQGDAPKALAAWLAVARDFPESKLSLTHLELLADSVHMRAGKIGPEEWAKLEPLLIDAAKLKVVSAMNVLGETLRESQPEQSFHWFSAAAAQGLASAMTEVGLMYASGRGVKRDLVQAVASLTAASEKGDVGGKTALAECYLYGKGVAADVPRGIELLRQAADKGNVRAMNRLGTCYHQGFGTPQDFRAAFKLFTQAADLGSGEAMANLGVLYMNGNGVPQNPRKSLELFQKGADTGDSYSMFLLARCYEGGAGVAPNPLLARTWYKKSADAGNLKAADWLRRNGGAPGVR